MSWQAWSKYVSHMSQIIVFADWTRLPGSNTAIDGVSPQHGLSIAKIVPVEVPPLPRVESGLPRQTVINVSRTTGGNQIRLGHIIRAYPSQLIRCHQSTLGHGTNAPPDGFRSFGKPKNSIQEWVPVLRFPHQSTR